MDFPEFDKNIAVSGYSNIHQLVLEHKLVNPMLEESFEVCLLKNIQMMIYLWDGLYILHLDLISFSRRALFLKIMIIHPIFGIRSKHLNGIFEMYSSMFNGGESNSVRSATYSFFYPFQGYVLMFQLQAQTSKVVMRRALGVFELLFQLESGKNDLLIKEIDQTYHLKDKVIFFSFFDKHWRIADTIVVIAEHINIDYLKNADKRSNKPDVMLHEDFPDKGYTFSDSWVLEFDRLSTLMTRPNDISLFSSTADRNLKLAVEFYNKTILPRFKYYHGNFPDLKIQTEYYNYFEMITTALTFAYTAMEALANFLIPNDIQMMKT